MSLPAAPEHRPKGETMKILITGATGFIGAAVARALLDAGHQLSVLVRHDSDRINLDGLDVEPAPGDLRDAESLRRAMQGCSGLFHIAADYRLWAANPKEIYDTNVTGTRNLLAAAAKAGIERIVYTSSVCTLGVSHDGTPADENSQARLVDQVCDYKRSKVLAEHEVRRFIDDERLPIVIVHPSTPVGRGDIKPTPTGRMIREAALGRIPAYVDTGLNIVHVDDVATGHLLAFDKGVVGERYILGGTNLNLVEVLAIIADLTGQRPPTIRLPRNLVLPIAYLSELWAGMVTGREPLTTVAGVRMARHCMFYSSAKAECELGYRARPPRAALGDAVAWFVARESAPHARPAFSEALRLRP
jgi:dihydroflavonol-4-reductase